MNWHKMQSKRDKKEKKKKIKNEYWRHILKVILLEDEFLKSELLFYVWKIFSSVWLCHGKLVWK